MILMIILYDLVNAQIPSGIQDEFFNRKGNLIQVQTHPIDSNGNLITYDLLLVNNFNDTVKGKIRQPNLPGKKFPIAFLIVGIETGKEVVHMIEELDSVIIIGIDYPYKGGSDFSGWDGIGSAFELRETGFRTVPQIMLCLDWLSSLSNVDTVNITLIAVSYGVFYGVPAAVIDTRVDRLVVVQAGGDLSIIVKANVERLEIPIPSWIAGWLGEIVMFTFEPNRYIGELSPRPLLMISGESDVFFPRASVQSLYDHAREPKEWIQHRSSHVMPGERELIVELTNIIARRLYGVRK